MVPNPLLAVSAALLAGAAPAPSKAPAGARAGAAPGTPKTEAETVTDTYHGVAVADPYRWLEDGADPTVKAWTSEQNAYARKVLDALPGVPEIRARVTEMLAAPVTTYGSLQQAGGRLFAMKREPPKEQPFLVVMPSADRPEEARVLVDPNALDAAGTTHLDWYEASPDGKLVAVSLSKGGTESGDLHLYDVETGKPTGEVVPGVNGGTAGGDMAWAKDGKGFYYSRYPRAGERPEEERHFWVQVYFHALGTPTEEDRYELGKDFPKIAEIELGVDGRTGRVLATIQNGDGGEFAHYLKEPAKGAPWRQFSRFEDKTLQAAFGPKDRLFLLSREGAPRGKVLSIDAKTLDVAKAKVVVPEGEDTVVQGFWGDPTIVATDSRLLVTYQLGGPSTVRVFDLDGKPVKGPEHPPVAAVDGLTPLGKDAVLFATRTFVSPTAWSHFDAKTGRTTPTALSSRSPADFSDVRVVRETATSKDGTKVPVNIMIPGDLAQDGSHPMVVYGYGGYGVNIEPRFQPQLRALFDRGVIYAVANLRGGGEFGEAWHKEGNLTKKQNVFDDFAAVLEHVVARGYTRHDRLGITGGSNGGLLMGATFTQHPTYARSVVSFVGIYDMLRVELSPNGAFNITEFGTVKDEAQFRALHAYSPYHHVEPGTAYPPILLLTGENDPRVDPMQSRKMAARLQAATTSKEPVLLRTSAQAGHGGDSSLTQKIEEFTDAYAFLCHHLGAAARP